MRFLCGGAVVFHLNNENTFRLPVLVAPTNARREFVEGKLDLSLLMGIYGIFWDQKLDKNHSSFTEFESEVRKLVTCELVFMCFF